MKGDFARITFDPRLHFSQVLHQQGRVLLEADWNEQGAIQLHLVRSLIVDLVGHCWAAGSGFQLRQDNPNGTQWPLKDWRLSPGHFYVDGILCENDIECTLATQPHRPTPDGGADGSHGFENPPDRFVLYLDTWERHLSGLEAPALLDLALEGVDTASRAQVVWQIRMLDIDAAVSFCEQAIAAMRLRDDVPASAQELLDPDFDVRQKIEELFDALGEGDERPRTEVCHDLRILLTLRNRFAYPRLKASLGAIDVEDDPCIVAPDARYRGCENQLYRVEIHSGGLAMDGEERAATFKWSRENGSVVFPIVSAPVATGVPAASGGIDYTLGLGHLGRDARLGLSTGDWVELSDDAAALGQRSLPLLKVVAVNAALRRVTINVPAAYPSLVPSVDMTRHPLLRRWDQRENVASDGTLDVFEGDDGIELEDGVTIAFMPGGLYAPGDHWTIAARASGDGSLDWPMEGGEPLAIAAKGAHHYAALGGAGRDGAYLECACRITALCDQAETTRMPTRRSSFLVGDGTHTPGSDSRAVSPKPKPTGGTRVRKKPTR